MARFALPPCRLLGLGLAACCACQDVPELPGSDRAPGLGVFPSSQLKPSPPAAPPPFAQPRAADRSMLQAAYFAGPADPAAKAALLGPPGPPAGGEVHDLHAGPLPWLTLTLQRGQTVLLETLALSPGSDTVLHLLWRQSGEQLAFDDDGGPEPGSSRLRYTADRPGAYLVLLRPYATGDRGSCDLWVDGSPRLQGVRFGGSALAVAGDQRLTAVLLNDGQSREPWPPAGRAARDPLLLLLDPQSGALLALDDDSGVELGAELWTPGQPTVALLGAYQPETAGSARLVLNDAPLGDADGDGLGDDLEQHLCLCSRRGQQVCGYSCALAQTPQDTDGDGLSDAVELLGLDHPLFPQLLPRWGADPRHKDLLVEIDLADWTDPQTGEQHQGRTLEPDAAHAAARVFARLSEMQNPDGQPGIRLHLDLGQPCGPQATGIDEVCGDFCALGQDGVRRCGQSTVSEPEDRLGNLAPGRRHLFHLAVADCLIAGSAPGAAADHLTYDCDRFTALVHELGHNLGLSHHHGGKDSGGGNCKPNYPSLMNYAYADRFAGGKELRFSEGQLVEGGALDPTELDETRPLGGPTAEVGWLAARPFFFELHNCRAPGVGCQVDFNRDGLLDPSVRAFLSPMPGYGYVCEGEQANALYVEDLPGLTVQGGVGACELPRRRADGSFAPALHVFAVAQALGQPTLQVSYTHQQNGGWAPWRGSDGPPLPPAAPVAAVTWRRGERQTALAFVCSEGPQPIWQAALDTEGNLSALEPVPGQPPWLRAEDVSVVQQGADVILVTRDARPEGGDQLYASRRSPAGWSGSFAALTAEGQPLRSLVTPGLALASDGRIYLVSADPDPPPGSGPAGRLHLYSAADLLAGLRDEELEGLSFADGRPDHNHELWGRPALAFVPHLDGAGQPLPGGRGYLALWWLRGTRVRFLWSWGQLAESGARFRLGRWHHYEAQGFTDALPGASPALVLRGGRQLSALLPQGQRAPGKLRHVPYADGIPPAPLPLEDFDDRPVLRQNLCRGLNWDCPQRCFDLRAPCGEEQTAPSEVHCDLPRWQEEPWWP